MAIRVTSHLLPRTHFLGGEAGRQAGAFYSGLRGSGDAGAREQETSPPPLSSSQFTFLPKDFLLCCQYH